MAIQTATSTSSTADSTPSTTTSSTNSTTTTNNSNPNDLGRNSIPFSFLVAFLALFVAFMGIGLFAKRLIYFIRLRLGLPIPEPNARRKVPKAKKEKPVLWDVYPEKRNTSEEGDGRWRNIKPLSCYFLRDVPQSDTSPSTSSPTTSPNPPTSPSYTRTTHTRSHTLLPQAFVGTGRMAIAPLPPPPPPRPLFYSPDSNSIRSRPRMTSARTRTPPNPIQDLITTSENSFIRLPPCKITRLRKETAYLARRE
ncbi:hypothetical protein BC629DRAFT_1597099 [Irpex lacteus]|nr:hypothetical protein BC629DRAFT_1597099 [Irpex lacteus]